MELLLAAPDAVTRQTLNAPTLSNVVLRVIRTYVTALVVQPPALLQLQPFRLLEILI